jgi:hypothetical protein
MYIITTFSLGGMDLEEERGVSHTYGLPLLQNEVYALYRSEVNSEGTSTETNINDNSHQEPAYAIPLGRKCSLCTNKSEESLLNKGERRMFSASIPLSASVWHLLNQWRPPSSHEGGVGLASTIGNIKHCL